MKEAVHKKIEDEHLPCLQCGMCCFVDLTAYARESDFDRWRAEHRQDILDVIEHRRRVWAGDRLVSADTGDFSLVCPFLERGGKQWRCAIYETRPLVCREYQTGTSQLCPQYRKNGIYKK